MVIAFEPCHDAHAIAEVTFALTPDAPLTHEERERLKEAHPDTGQDRLPKLVEGDVLELALLTPGRSAPPWPIGTP